MGGDEGDEDDGEEDEPVFGSSFGEMIEALDADGDGKLSLAEFHAVGNLAAEEEGKIDDESMGHMMKFFKAHDKDGDGHITHEEAHDELSSNFMEELHDLHDDEM